jgi:hypothetical protein
MTDAAVHPDNGASWPADIPRFITGMSRAGTQWMSKCLNEHPDAAAFGESMFFGRRYVAPGPDGLYRAEHYVQLRKRLLEHGTCVQSTSGTGPGSLKRIDVHSIASLVKDLFPDDAPPMTPGGAFVRLSRAIAEREGKRVAIEKTPHHLNWIGRILAALPEARFIIMVREPYSFMLSYKHQGDRKDARVRSAFAKRYHPAACALVWKASMARAREAMRVHGDRAMMVPFDDLRLSPRDTLEKVQRFFGLELIDLSSAVPPDNTSFPQGARPRLHPEDYFWMNRIAGRSMRSEGYALAPVPVASWRIAWSFLRLPWWALRNYFNLRSRVSGSTLSYLMRWIRPAGDVAASEREMNEV